MSASATFPLAQRPTVRLGLAGLSAVGYALCLSLLLSHGIYSDGGLGAGDLFAYWTAGRHLLEGASVYGAGVGGYAAFLYPPPFAQVFAPIALLPFPVVVWAWRAVELGCLRVATGSWTSAGIALLVWPPVIAEMDAGNVHLILAAATAMVMRGNARAIVPVALTKFASLVLVPLAFIRDRTGLMIGIAAASVVVVASVLVDAGLWRTYLTFATAIPNGDEGWYNIGAVVPLWVRLGLAALAGVAAMRWVRLAPVAVVLALPVLWVHGLSILVAVRIRPAPAATPSGGTQSRSQPRRRLTSWRSLSP